MPGLEVGKELRIAQALRLQEGQAVVEGILFDGRIGNFETSACLAVGDGDNTDDVMACLTDSIEGGDGEVGGTHKDDVHLLNSKL